MNIKKFQKSFLSFISIIFATFICLIPQVSSYSVKTEILNVSGTKTSYHGATKSNVLIIGEGNNRKFFKEKHILINSNDVIRL